MTGQFVSPVAYIIDTGQAVVLKSNTDSSYVSKKYTDKLRSLAEEITRADGSTTAFILSSGFAKKQNETRLEKHMERIEDVKENR